MSSWTKEPNPLENIPDGKMYKVEDVPDLMKFRKQLEKEGLKDPWERNHVWKYNPRFGTMTKRWIDTIFRGWRVAIPAFLITIGVEYALGIDYKPEHLHDDDDEGHGKGHH